eukprot:TRINITY_DN14083_c0_g1_i1.p1 TRINITY_DN14083_c0_g1~~TRINITY_DN14083_c0_g1_i1.p1  ORF type:complete len:531 (+),score=79.24 TRINITY_DN14083_c0_g1_i1:145-1737(+)
MFRLPRSSRRDDGVEAQRGALGRQVLLEAFGFTGAIHTEEPGAKLVVKNTFLDLRAPTDSELEAERSAQTWPISMFRHGGQDDPQDDDDRIEGMHSDETVAEPEFPSSVTVLPEGVTLLSEQRGMDGHIPAAFNHPGQAVAAAAASACQSRGPARSAASSEDRPYVVKNTFIDVIEGESPNSMPSAASCTARLHGVDRPSSFIAEDMDPHFEPAHFEPAHFEQQAPSQPSAPSSALLRPAQSSRTGDLDATNAGNAVCLPGVGRQILLEAFGFGLGNDSPDHRHVVVKNTFIEFEEDSPHAFSEPRGAKSCTARLAGCQVPGLMPTSPVASSSSRSALPASEGQQPPSVGSALHGVPGPEGQPACQPCAWFYKDAGCHNGAQCRYCHLCPMGELKSRKKAKVARFREQEAAEAAAAAPAPAGSLTVLEAAIPHGATLVKGASLSAPSQPTVLTVPTAPGRIVAGSSPAAGTRITSPLTSARTLEVNQGSVIPTAALAVGRVQPGVTFQHMQVSGPPLQASVGGPPAHLRW